MSLAHTNHRINLCEMVFDYAGKVIYEAKEPFFWLAVEDQVSLGPLVLILIFVY